MKITLALVLILSSLSAYSELAKFEDAKVFKFLTISGQPSKEALDTVKEKKFDIVIDLRNPKEMEGFNEKSYVEKKGLIYANIPFFDKDKKINQENFNKITSYVEKNKDKKIFIHCTTGNRAAAWLLIHLNKDHDMDLEKALKISEDMGLTKAEMKDKTIKFMKN